MLSPRALFARRALSPDNAALAAISAVKDYQANAKANQTGDRAGGDGKVSDPTGEILGSEIFPSMRRVDAGWSGRALEIRAVRRF
jgi:hypothetical protein